MTLRRLAIIDLGTNTFQLLIVDVSSQDKSYQILHENQYAAKIGKGGISEGIITEEGILRAIDGFRYFEKYLNEFGVSNDTVIAIGTSAIRNAKNAQHFKERILKATGIDIIVVSGDEEADLICDGVRLGVEMQHRNALIMDIGGGSVEFILCNDKRIFWKQSFEIGGQRLMDKFMTSDPITPKALTAMHNYLEEQLLPLTNAIHQYQPEVLIGSAGSFETLADMYWHQLHGSFPDKGIVSFDLPMSSFSDSLQKIISADRAARMALPGMIELRVDMIVVGVYLIHFILKKYGIEEIKVSTYALKEGVLSKILNGQSLPGE